MGDQIQAKLTLEGSREMRHLCEELPRRVVEKGLKQAVTAAGTPIVRAARREVPVESGLLKKAINKKVKLYRDKETAIAVIGARTDVQGEVRGNVRKPSKYIRIVVAGAKPHSYAKRKGSHPGFPANDFLSRAEASERANSLEIAQAKLMDVLEKEADRLARK